MKYLLRSFLIGVGVLSLIVIPIELIALIGKNHPRISLAVALVVICTILGGMFQEMIKKES